MEAIVVKVAIVIQFGSVEWQLSVSCYAGGDNVELKVIVKTKYQTKEKYVVTIKYCNSLKKFKLFLCVAYMCMWAAQLNYSLYAIFNVIIVPNELWLMDIKKSNNDNLCF